MVRFDSLTGLPNREYFIELVQREHLGRAPRPGSDRHSWFSISTSSSTSTTCKGHVAGDRLLVQDRRAPQGCGSRARRSAARLMGDQFVLFFPNEERPDRPRRADARAARRHGGRLQGRRHDFPHFVQRRLRDRSTASSSGRRNGRSRRTWRCSRAKSRGKRRTAGFEQRNGCPLYREPEAEGGSARGGRAGDLHAGLPADVQPDGSRIECCEALSRWVHPEKGLMPPDVFVQMAEDMGIVSDITRFMLETACRDCATWPEHDCGLGQFVGPGSARQPTSSAMVGERT